MPAMKLKLTMPEKWHARVFVFVLKYQFKAIWSSIRLVSLFRLETRNIYLKTALIQLNLAIDGCKEELMSL